MIKCVLLVLALTIWGTHALNNGLAFTPPMGWLSWERFRCNTNCKRYPTTCISENLYKAQADMMVSNPYKYVGYLYVNIDDCWAAKERDANGRLVADPERFPSGIKALADYMHARGLKLGIYGDIGTKTCAGYPGSQDYMELDAQTFAEWGVDSLKMDGCHANIDDFAIAYPKMEYYLNKTGRPILFSCSWPAYVNGHKRIPNYEAIAKTCNLWRNYHDIVDSWKSVLSIIEWFAKDEGNFTRVAGPGRWNDPDMLIVGDRGLTIDQQKVQMAMWAIMAAPLYMSNDLRNISRESFEVLLNVLVIDVNQDPLGIQGHRLSKDGDIQIWIRPIAPPGSIAVAVLNLAKGGSPRPVTFKLEDLGLYSPYGYRAIECFGLKPLGVYLPQMSMTVEVNPTGVFLGIIKLQGV